MLRYLDLIDDHDAIVAASRRLLATADDTSASAADIGHQLSTLATIVGDHIAAEAPLATALDARQLPGPWAAVWQQERPAFAALCAEWQGFLGEWDQPAIEGDLQGFRQEAHRLMSTLEERLALETRTFYALGLQTSEVSFHLR